MIGGRFALGSLADRGGMGEIHRAVDLERDRAPVAIKLLSFVGEGSGRRFAREARLLRDLDHEGIVSYIDHGVTEDGRAFLAMEWIEGCTLAERMAEGTLTPADGHRVASQLAAALAAVHARGVVHRDVKPRNVMLQQGRLDRVKLLDFGIAHLDRRTLAQTATGVLLGTPEYMSPEQARGARGIGPASDVFSVGVLLYEALSGRSPFRAPTAVATVGKILFSDPAPLAMVCPAASAALSGLVARMLRKRAAERPADGAGLLAELRELEDSVESLPPPDADTVRPALTLAERHVLTVLVAVGSSSGADLAHTGVATVGDLRPQVDALRAELEPTGANVEPLLDGGLIATWTEGDAREQATTACRAGWDLVRRVGASVGVATGRGDLERALPAGPVIDRAVAHVAPGGVRVDEATAELVAGRVRLSEDRVVESVSSPGRDAGGRLMGRPSPMQGRARELRLLAATFEQCAEEPMARAVVVVADPGVGKTRLRVEACARLRGVATLLVGHGDPMRAGSALGVLADALRDHVGVERGEAAEVTRARLSDRLARHLPIGALAEATEFLAELLHLPVDEGRPAIRSARREPRLLGDRIRRAYLAWLDGLSARGPVVIVLEDLHFGDVATLGFVDDALRELAGRPLLVLAFARPDLLERHPDLWRSRAAEHVRLGPLSPRAARRIARASIGEADDAEVERLVALAAGNPLCLEEVLRAHARGDEAPPTLRAMLDQRLRSLAAEERQALRAASVFGTVFWRAGLESLLGHTEEAVLSRALRRLIEGEWIEARPPGRFPVHEELAFRHSLVRDAAYDMLTGEDRALGHRLAARWLLAAGERDPLPVAQHFARAGDGPAAARFFARAAEQSLAVHDLALAAERAGAGTAHAEGEVRGRLRLVMAEVERWRGRHAAARAAAGEALRLLPEGSAPWLAAARELISGAGRTGDPDAAGRAADEVCRVDDEVQRSAQVVAICEAARVMFHAGRYEEAEGFIDRAEALAAGSEIDPSADAELHRVRGARARQYGDSWGDVGGYRASLARYEEAGDLRSAQNARVSLGFALAELGELEHAESTLRRALAVAEHTGLPAVATRARHNLGMVLAELGRLEEAEEVERAAAQEAAARGDRRLEGGSRVYLSQIALAAGDGRRAAREAALAAERFEDTPPAQAGARAAWGRALLSLGDVAGARAQTEPAWQLLAGLAGIEEYEALIALAHAEVLVVAGEAEEALAVARRGEERLSWRARHAPSAAARARFLERDAHNAALVALCRRLSEGTT